MTEKELRIGNYVEWNKENYDVDGIDCVSIQVDNGWVHTPIEEFSPIPLTEEWLVKFGFEQGDQRGYFPPKFLKKYTPVLVENKIEVEFIDEKILMWMEGNTNVHMRYVHQLQNLYFAITGEELTIK